MNEVLQDNGGVPRKYGFIIHGAYLHKPYSPNGSKGKGKKIGNRRGQLPEGYMQGDDIEGLRSMS
jgi:hypothetical protein